MKWVSVAFSIAKGGNLCKKRKKKENLKEKLMNSKGFDR